MLDKKIKKEQKNRQYKLELSMIEFNVVTYLFSSINSNCCPYSF
jgi:hypothetical protein